MAQEWKQLRLHADTWDKIKEKAEEKFGAPGFEHAYLRLLVSEEGQPTQPQARATPVKNKKNKGRLYFREWWDNTATEHWITKKKEIDYIVDFYKSRIKAFPEIYEGIEELFEAATWYEEREPNEQEMEAIRQAEQELVRRRKWYFEADRERHRNIVKIPDEVTPCNLAQPGMPDYYGDDDKPQV